RGPARDPAHDARLGRHAPPRPAMTFRARLLLGFGAVVLVPLTVFGLRIRAVMANRLTAEYQQRVAALVSVIRADLDRQSAAIALRLAALRDAIPRDNLFRTALQGGERTHLLDYAGDAMQLAGLSLLQIQDESGRIVSSGHFRNEYDRSDPALPRLLATAPAGTALVEARTAEAPFLALARLAHGAAPGGRAVVPRRGARDRTDRAAPGLLALDPDQPAADRARGEDRRRGHGPAGRRIRQ